MRIGKHLITTLVLCAVSVPAARADSTDSKDSSAPASRHQDLAGQLAFSVTAGQFGLDPLFSVQVAFFPTSRFGMEATLAHNPSSATHAALHHVSGVLQLRRSGVLRPYAVAGLGTIQVFPGTAMNAKTVTKLLMHAGGGMQVHVRDDVAFRFETRSAGILDSQEDHRGLLGYLQWNAGVTFYRSLSAPSTFDTGGAQ